MIDLDKQSIEISCPRCGFYNPVFLRQVKLRDVVICRGCKVNIQLDDYMNEYRKTEKSIQNLLAELESKFKNLTVSIKL